MLRRIALPFLFSLTATHLANGADAAALWSTKVQPLFDVNCVKCHGPLDQKSGLELDTPQAALKGSEDGPVIVPGKPEESALWQNLAAKADPHMPPIVSVGALNPNLDTDALFSNAGTWVRTYTPGMAVMSTMPAYQGGGQPEFRREYLGRVRESLDPDDFRGGFGVWSGTSFAAPLLAGRLAADLCDRLPDASAPFDKDATVQQAWAVVEKRAGITP